MLCNLNKVEIMSWAPRFLHFGLLFLGLSSTDTDNFLCQEHKKTIWNGGKTSSFSGKEGNLHKAGGCLVLFLTSHEVNADTKKKKTKTKKATHIHLCIPLTSRLMRTAVRNCSRLATAGCWQQSGKLGEAFQKGKIYIKVWGGRGRHPESSN